MRTGVRLVTGLAAAAGLLVRRRRPFWLLAAAILDGLAGGEVSAALPFAAYAVTRYGPAGRARWIAVAVAAAVALAPWQFTSFSEGLNNVLLVGLFVVLPAVLGAWVRTRAELVAALVDRAERAEREQQLRAREAVLGERDRITREMHDVVGHRVSLMVLQSGAIEMAADDPVRVRQLAGQLQDAGRRALEELRQLIGLVRGGGRAARPAADPRRSGRAGRGRRPGGGGGHAGPARRGPGGGPDGRAHRVPGRAGGADQRRQARAGRRGDRDPGPAGRGRRG